MAKVATTTKTDWQTYLANFVAEYAVTNKRGDSKYIGLRFGQISGVDEKQSKVQGKAVYIDFLDTLIENVQKGQVSNLSIDKATNKIVTADGSEFTRGLVLERMEKVMGMAIVRGPKGGYQYASMPTTGTNGAVVVVKAGKPKISRY